MDLSNVIILGIDPGYATVGFGVVEFNNMYFKALDFGAICTSSNVPFENRLEDIFNSLENIFKTYHIDIVSLEKLFFQNNQKTAINVAQARGVILLAAKRSEAHVFEYTPLQVKASITGSGRAPKIQVMQMVRKLLNLKNLPKFDDTADALALTICYARNMYGFTKV